MSQKNWWDEEMFLGLTRENVLLILAFGAVIALNADVNWDWVFGFRPK